MLHFLYRKQSGREGRQFSFPLREKEKCILFFPERHFLGTIADCCTQIVNEGAAIFKRFY